MIRGFEACVFLGAGSGKKASFVLIASSVALVLISFFYIYSAASYFKIDVWDMQGRVSYTLFFETFVLNKTIDHLIIALTTSIWFALSFKHKIRFGIATVYGISALISTLLNMESIADTIIILSLPTISILLIFNMLLPNKYLITDRNLVISYFCVVGIGFSLLTLIISIQPVYFLDEDLNSFRSLAYEIFLIFTGVSPVLLILLIFSAPVKIIIDEFLALLRRHNIKFANSMRLSENRTSIRTRIIFLSLFMFLSTAMVMIPHQSSINMDKKDVGVDTHYYVEEIEILMNSTNVQELFHNSFVAIQHGDRPFTLLFFLMVAQLSHSDDLSYVFDNVPLVLGPSLVLVFYFLTRQLTSNDTASLFSAFLTAVSFHTLIGIYAGSYANWLALIVGYLSIVFLLRSLKEINPVNILTFLVLLDITLLTHIYTWSIFALVIGIFLFVLLKLKYYAKRNIIILLIVLLSSVFIDILRTTVTGSYGGIGYNISPPFGAIVQLGPEQFSVRWNTIIDTTLSFLGSLFGNSIIFALGLYWLIRTRLRETSTIFMLVFLSIGIVPLFFGNWFAQARIFYDIPFQIPAAIALAYLFRRKNGPLVIIAVSIWLIALSIRAVTNFYFIQPI